MKAIVVTVTIIRRSILDFAFEPLAMTSSIASTRFWAATLEKIFATELRIVSIQISPSVCTTLILHARVVVRCWRNVQCLRFRPQPTVLQRVSRRQQQQQQAIHLLESRMEYNVTLVALQCLGAAAATIAVVCRIRMGLGDVI